MNPNDIIFMEKFARDWKDWIWDKSLKTAIWMSNEFVRRGYTPLDYEDIIYISGVFYNNLQWVNVPKNEIEKDGGKEYIKKYTDAHLDE